MARFVHTEKFSGPKKFNSHSKKFSGRDSESSSRSSSPRKFTRRDDGDSGSRRPDFQLHKAICDACGRECDLPFKPTGSKPIYCRSCFRKDGPQEPRRDFERSDSRSRDDFKSEPNFDADKLDQIEKKLDKIMKFLKIN
jgi:CxxC-x17-CxxC domain-containing protein